MNSLNSRNIARLTLTAAAGLTLAALGSALVGCDRETSTHKETSTKVVDTPEGPKKVTEKTETTTTTEKKNNP